jgi:hypothetical protein
VYNVSQFAFEHPGGAEIIYKFAGRDATKDFLAIHPPEYACEFVGPAVGVLPTASLLASRLPKAGLGVYMIEAESFAALRKELRTKILTITGGFGAMVQRYMREQVLEPSYLMSYGES